MTRAGWSGTVVPVDMCELARGFGDGEHEGGIGGSVFPAGASFCRVSPDLSHHAYGVGASYWAVDDFGNAIVYAAGADGPALVQDPPSPRPCGTDGVVSDDPVTDPLDCGAGWLGYSTAWPVVPATLGETVPGNGACDPFDGYVVVAVGEGVVASTLVQGNVRD